MSTALGTAVINKGAIMETTKDNRPKLKDRNDLQELVADVLALRKMAKTDNFLTHKAQRALLAKLNPLELAVVARAVAEEEKKQQPIFMDGNK